jgi:hypothetical protein
MSLRVNLLFVLSLLLCIVDRSAMAAGDLCKSIVNMTITLHALEHHALASSLFPRRRLARAVSKLGFVQADPIRSLALILRHRVTDYLVE